MSIFRPCRPLGPLALALAACAQLADTSATLRVAGKSVTLVAPDGYCVDRQAVDVTAAGGFVLLADCAILGSDQAGSAAPSAVISATITPEGLNGSLTELREFLTTSPGKVTLGRSGQIEAIRVIRSLIRDDILLIKAEDRGPQPIPGISPTIWRGFFVTADRAVTMSVSGSAAQDLSDTQAIQLLLQTAQRSRAANPDPGDAGSKVTEGHTSG